MATLQVVQQAVNDMAAFLLVVHIVNDTTVAERISSQIVPSQHSAGGESGSCSLCCCETELCAVHVRQLRGSPFRWLETMYVCKRKSSTFRWDAMLMRNVAPGKREKDC